VSGIEEALFWESIPTKRTAGYLCSSITKGRRTSFVCRPERRQKQAEKFETKKKSELFFEAHGVSERKETLYEDFLVDIYLPFIEANRCKTTFDHAVIVCRSSLKFLKGRTFRSIRPADIEKFKTYRMNLPTIQAEDRERSGSTIAKEISHISKVFSMAIKNDLCEYNPCSRVELPQFDNVQDKVLRPEDEERLFAEFKSDWARDVCKVILNTGCVKTISLV
jgi:hypothetical protein